MINRRLGLTALILGGAAVLMPSRGGIDSAGNPGPIPGNHDSIEADSLAAWIMEDGTSGMTLVDLRSQSDFEAYHIPGALRMGAAQLELARLPVTTIVVLYDEAELSAPRVWLLLKAQGYDRVYVLSGGVAAWNDEVLHPPLPPGMGRADGDEFAERLERSRFFGGSPVPAPARRVTTPRPRPDSAGQRKESFDIGPGGCFY